MMSCRVLSLTLMTCIGNPAIPGSNCGVWGTATSRSSISVKPPLLFVIPDGNEIRADYRVSSSARGKIAISVFISVDYLSFLTSFFLKRSPCLTRPLPLIPCLSTRLPTRIVLLEHTQGKWPHQRKSMAQQPTSSQRTRSYLPYRRSRTHRYPASPRTRASTHPRPTRCTCPIPLSPNRRRRTASSTC